MGKKRPGTPLFLKVTNARVNAKPEIQGPLSLCLGHVGHLNKKQVRGPGHTHFARSEIKEIEGVISRTQVQDIEGRQVIPFSCLKQPCR